MEENQASSVSIKNFLPLALGLIACALGAAALFLSINAAAKLSVFEKEASEKLDKAMSVAVEFKGMNSKIDNVVLQFEDMKSASKLQSETINTNLRKTVDAISNAINENRNLIVANQNAIKELAERSIKRAEPVAVAVAPNPVPTDSTEATPATSTSSDDDSKIYVIKSGDTFSKIAKQFKVSIEAIEKANPNTSSSKLQIGQKIVIP